ncbi:MAG: hypothetical protein FJ125_06305, partial [Deltaproteobacteria bacterium]|nr:hypothetical protein [Deltaproteobacteria bacterium]
ATGRPEFHGDRCLYCADCIRACPTSAWQPGPNGWIVRVGGRHGRHPHNASVVAWLIPDALVLAVCRVVLDWYGQHGKGKGRTRIGELLKEPGAIQSLLASLEPVVGDHLVRDAAPPEPIVIHHYLRPPAALLAGIARAPASEPTQQELTIHKVLDLCGLKCPVPQAMLKLALERMQPGQGLEVLVDEGSISALPKVVKEDGHRIDDLREIAAGRYRLHIERK